MPYLGSLPCCELLLNRNASLPWFILVPDSPLDDVLDLAEADLRGVLGECAQVSAFIKQSLGYTKVNFAGLGNVVSQMHLHIIGRRIDDACWPAPVWGQLPAGEVYTQEQLRELQQDLVRAVALVAVAL